MSTVKANDLMNVAGGIPTVKSQQLIPTAWINFSGLNTISIRDSANISSITDIATGKYRATFATAMANANWACAMACAYETALDVNNSNPNRDAHPYTQTTTFIEIATIFTGDRAHYDADDINVIIMGGQA